MILILPLFSPFVKTAEAYGGINHEKVVDAGKGHFVVLKEDGSVWSWGDNTYGQMGSFSSVPNAASAPIPIKKADGNRLLNIKAIAAGGYHTVALDQNGGCMDMGPQFIWTISAVCIAILIKMKIQKSVRLPEKYHSYCCW